MQTSPHTTERQTNLVPHAFQIIQQFAKETHDLLKENVIAVYLYGSYSTNTQTPLSDIDILIIVKHYTPELQWQISGLASVFSLKYDICFSPILQDILVWEKNQEYRTLFYQEIIQHSIPL